LPIHWTEATKFPETATHAIDFGPGGLSGIGPLTACNMDGRGVRVVVVGERGKGDAELYSAQGVKYEDWWSKRWAAGLVRTRFVFKFHVLSTISNIVFAHSDGTMYIDTPFSRLLGKPPIMVAGMTPTTVKGGFVSAILDAGYHVELAGGGHYNATALRTKVAEITSKIPAGVGITLNSLYINPRQFGFQLPLWQEMRREGLPIEGFCVAAGIPSTEKAAEITHSGRLALNTSLSSPEVSMGSVKLSTSLLVTLTSLSFFSRLEAVLEAIIPSRTSTNPFSPPTVQYAVMAIFPLWLDLVLALQTMFGHIYRETGPSRHMACSRCRLMASFLPAALWSPRKLIRAHL
jgi:hypothetical protein